MPQKFFIVESEDEVHAKHAGFAGGLEVGYKKGFTSASMLWIFIILIYLFFSLQNISYLTDLRVKMSQQLKAQLPQHSEYIDLVIPDGSLEGQLKIIRENRETN